MQAVYLPGDVTGSPFAELLRGRDPAGYLRQYPYDVSSVSDNSPFFFYTARTSDVWDFVRNGARSGDGGNINGAVPLLLRLVGLSLLATAIMLTLPPLILGGRLPRHRGVLRFLWYFVFVGAGYLLVQVALIQKFVLFLGHPTYALTVIIFSMLVSSGLGSYYSRRVIASSDRSLMGVLAVVALLVAALAVVISPLMAFGAGWPLVLKLAITLVLIAPVGFAMGMPFPAGLARLAQQHAPSVRWAWSLNAAASVMGSVCAIFLAIHLGLRETLLVGGVMYLCALISVQFSSPLPASRPGAAETG